MKRLTVALALVAGLAGAGVAGAVVEAKLFTVERGQWARLVGTDVYCQAFVPKQTRKPAFECARWMSTRRVGNTYSAVIDDLGIEVDRWDASGRTAKTLRTYYNP